MRIVEEPYLLTVHGDAYRDYLANVGRFVPESGSIARQVHVVRDRHAVARFKFGGRLGH